MLSVNVAETGGIFHAYLRDYARTFYNLLEIERL
jgi:hypothetical protein